MFFEIKSLSNSQISGFKCSLGEPKVLHLDLLCDGVKHCLSGIDESHCGPSTRRAAWRYVTDDSAQCAEQRGGAEVTTHQDSGRQNCVVGKTRSSLELLALCRYNGYTSLEHRTLYLIFERFSDDKVM